MLYVHKRYGVAGWALRVLEMRNAMLLKKRILSTEAP
jgi:hypothetical protein